MHIPWARSESQLGNGYRPAMIESYSARPEGGGTERRRDKGLDQRMDGQTDGWTDERRERQMDRRTDGQTDGQTDG